MPRATSGHIGSGYVRPLEPQRQRDAGVVSDASRNVEASGQEPRVRSHPIWTPSDPHAARMRSPPHRALKLRRDGRRRRSIPPCGATTTVENRCHLRRQPATPLYRHAFDSCRRPMVATAGGPDRHWFVHRYPAPVHAPNTQYVRRHAHGVQAIHCCVLPGLRRTRTNRYPGCVDGIRRRQALRAFALALPGSARCTVRVWPAAQMWLSAALVWRTGGLSAGHAAGALLAVAGSIAIMLIVHGHLLCRCGAKRRPCAVCVVRRSG